MKRLGDVLVWLMIVTGCLLIPFMACHCHGSDRPATDPRDAVVEVFGGSGVCVDSRGLVLTCKHYLPRGDHIFVTFAGRKPIPARVVWETQNADGVVALDVDGSGYPWLPVAKSPPKPGSPVTVWARLNGQTCGRSGNITGMGTLNYPRHPRPNVIANSFNQVITDGWSGGPMLTQNCEVAGVGLSSSKRAGNSYYTTVAETRFAYEAVMATGTAALNVDPSATPIERIVITVYIDSSISCYGCFCFKRDLQLFPDRFRLWEFRFVDLKESPNPAIEQVPAFVWPGGSCAGYTDAEKLTAILPKTQPKAATATPIRPIPDDQVPPATHPGKTLTPIADSAPQPGPMQPPPERRPAPEKPAARIERRISVEAVTGFLGTGLTIWQIATGTAIGVSGFGIAGAIAWGVWKGAKAIGGAVREKRTRQAERNADPRAGPYGPGISYHVPPMPIVRVPHHKAIEAAQHAFERGIRENALDDRMIGVLEKVHGYYRMAMNAPDQEER